jgi:hypothetical protein
MLAICKVHSVEAANIAELTISVLEDCEYGSNHRDNDSQSFSFLAIHRLDALLF